VTRESLLILAVATASAQSVPDAVSTLRRECIGCHGEGQTLAKLDLRSREAALRGGQRGPSLVPGNAGDSLLVRALEGRGLAQMPPGKPLPAEQVAAIRRWIDEGAPWIDAKSATQWTYRQEDLWAFQPVRSDASRRIDDFLKPGPKADRRTLIRRATFDLAGLPPTPAEVEAFVNDRSPDAWSKVVERLLASPRYGERWARHWLDVVRYADTNGYSNDFERPNAWRYRDYVIRAFNNDKPYDRFIREQVAGDELFPGDVESLIATGFLRAGPWEHTGMSVEAVTRQLFLDDVTNAVGVTFLGLTLGCARCHDHKFDPIPTRDYYRVQAVFAPTEFARPAAPFLPSENTSELAPGRDHMKQVVALTQKGIERFDEIAVRNAMRKHGVSKPEDLPPGAVRQAKQDKEGIGPAEFEEFKLHQKHMQMRRESMDRYEPKAFAVSSGPRDGETDGGPNLRYPKLAEYTAPPTHILPGGNVQSPGEKVAPGVLSAPARFGGYAEAEVPGTVSGRRAVLANWIADARNPLTARVMANRIWQYHYGRGLAADPNNFGKMGAKPTNPELLDWLAARLVAERWSIKALHRAIMLSDAYQQASFTPRRVEAEVLRDSILAVAGELSPDAGGPGAFAQINDDVARQPQHRMGSLAPVYRASPLKRQRNRRTIYTFHQRGIVDPMMDVFNAANMDVSCERREASTVPTQAFALFNGQFVHDMALAFAARLEREAAGSQARIERAFQLAYGRPPTAVERKASLGHLARMTAHHRANPAAPRKPSEPVVHKITSELTGEQHRFVQPEDPAAYEHNLHPSEVGPETRALADVTLAILNSNEFLYVY
jgi:hypothetical protein